MSPRKDNLLHPEAREDKRRVVRVNLTTPMPSDLLTELKLAAVDLATTNEALVESAIVDMLRAGQYPDELASPTGHSGTLSTRVDEALRAALKRKAVELSAERGRRVTQGQLIYHAVQRALARLRARAGQT